MRELAELVTNHLLGDLNLLVLASATEKGGREVRKARDAGRRESDAGLLPG